MRKWATFPSLHEPHTLLLRVWREKNAVLSMRGTRLFYEMFFNRLCEYQYKKGIHYIRISFLILPTKPKSVAACSPEVACVSVTEFNKLYFWARHLNVWWQVGTYEQGGWTGRKRGKTYILHLSVEQSTWGQLKRLYHNLGHTLWSETQCTLPRQEQVTHTCGRVPPSNPPHAHTFRFSLSLSLYQLLVS